MKKTKKVGSAARLGPRYGWKLRRQVRDVEKRAKALYECRNCGKIGLKRVGTGLWQCTKCGSVFAGGAYVPRTTEAAGG